MSTVSEAMRAAMAIDGAVGVALMDHASGLCLGEGGGGLGLDAAAVGNAAAVRAKLRTMGRPALADGVEDVLITLSGQYHLIRPLGGRADLFLYLALDRRRANLGLARHRLEQIEKALAV